MVRTGQERNDGESPPKVAVVIPCYNHGQYLREALASVRAQDWPNIECVLVDDGSNDEQTLRILRELEEEGVRVIRQENQGLAAARNIGVRAIEAPFFVPLDADDRIAPDFISKLIAPLLKDESLGYCYSHVTFFGATGGLWPCAAYDPRKILIENLSVATAVIRRSAFDAVGGYNREMVYGFEDWDFWLALLAAGYSGRCVPEPLFYYRKHPGGTSMLDKTQQHQAEMVRKMIEHHQPLFAATLLPENEKPTTEELYQALLAQAQLDSIHNSNSWRMVQKIKRNAIYRCIAAIGYGREKRAELNGSPSERLARIEASRFYRLIRAVKQLKIYKWYARRKYGPDFSD